MNSPTPHDIDNTPIAKIIAETHQRADEEADHLAIAQMSARAARLAVNQEALVQSGWVYTSDPGELEVDIVTADWRALKNLRTRTAQQQAIAIMADNATRHSFYAMALQDIAPELAAHLTAR